MFERIIGPVCGFYVVSYACPVGEFGQEYLGYFKICVGRAPSFDKAKAELTGSSSSWRETPTDAICDAEQCALSEIFDLCGIS